MTRTKKERLLLEAEIREQTERYEKQGGKVKALQWGETADDEKKRLARTRRISINGNEPFVR